MQTYFLKANHQALKNEFKHDFHEWTYYKPTYCNSLLLIAALKFMLKFLINSRYFMRWIGKNFNF